MALQGNIVDMPLVDLLQILGAQGKGGTLSVTHDMYYAEICFNRATLHFAALYWVRDGHLICQGEEAMYTLLSWTEGQFAFAIAPTPPMPQNVFVTINYIVMEHCLKCDSQHGQDRVSEMADVRPHLPLQPPLQAQINLDLEQWRLLTQINGVVTIGQLARMVGQHVESVLATLVELEQKGLVEIPRPSVAHRSQPEPQYASMQVARFGGDHGSVQQSHFSGGYDAPFIFSRQPQSLPAPSVPAMAIPVAKPKVQRGILSGIMTKLRSL